jgi:nucleoside-diphosphate-sugar epimerase
MTRLTGARVLLTGATGLIGRAVLPALAGLGAEVIVLSRSGRDVPGATQAVACDLLDAALMTRIVSEVRATHLVHLAWADGADRWHSPVNDDWAEATMALLRCFAASGGQRALIAGSCAEYDWTGPGLLSETTPLRPATRYGQAKARAGEAARAAAPGLGVALVWARPFFVYGPGEPEGRLVGDLVRGLRAGRAVDCTDGLQRRDFLYSGDLGQALANLLASGATGAVNVASGRAIPVRDLIGEVARQIGRPDLIRLGARTRPAADPAELCADVTLLTRATGFRPAHDLASGVAALLAAEGVAA